MEVGFALAAACSPAKRVGMQHCHACMQGAAMSAWQGAVQARNSSSQLPEALLPAARAVPRTCLMNSARAACCYTSLPCMHAQGMTMTAQASSPPARTTHLARVGTTYCCQALGFATAVVYVYIERSTDLPYPSSRPD